MKNKKPHVAVFFGGETANRDLSVESGYWACQYIPRDAYEVTPVHITSDGKWQVPLGSLPRQGSVARMMDMLFKGARKLSPKEGVQRLLSRPVDAFFSLIRGKGGDDGATHSLGYTLSVPVLGSNAATCQQTMNKKVFADQVRDIIPPPRSMTFKTNENNLSIAEKIRDEMVTPLFIKPNSQEGSHGVHLIDNVEDLNQAIEQTSGIDNLLVQEKIDGTEVNVTLFGDDKGKVSMLPPTAIFPKNAPFYDQMAKRKNGRVILNHLTDSHNPLLGEVEQIVRDVYDRLECQDYANFDLVASDKGIKVLEVNTIPTFTSATPTRGQMMAAGVSPGNMFSGWINRALREGF